MQKVERLYSSSLKMEVVRLRKECSLEEENLKLISDIYQKLGDSLCQNNDYYGLMWANMLSEVANKVGDNKLEEAALTLFSAYLSDAEERARNSYHEVKTQLWDYNPDSVSLENSLYMMDENSDHPGMEKLKLDSLYGPLTVEHKKGMYSGYIYFNLDDIGVRRYDYALFGKDDRKAGEIWDSISEKVAPRMLEILENERVIMGIYETFYETGKIPHGEVVIAKRIELPERFEDIAESERTKKKEVLKKGPPGNFAEYIASGGLHMELKQSEIRNRKLICMLKDEGVKLTESTLVYPRILWESGKETPWADELVELAYEELGNYGYEKVKIPKPTLVYGGKRDAEAEITQLQESSWNLVGEIITFDQQFPCGIPYHQREDELRNISKKFNESLKGEKPWIRVIKKDETGRKISETNISYSPYVPCGFREGYKWCATGKCSTDFEKKRIERKEGDIADIRSKETSIQLNEAMEALGLTLSEFYNGWEELDRRKRESL